MASDPTQRFTSRVADYVRYRPAYPPEVVELLERECGLSRVADVGSGTGILSRLLLQAGATVYGVEPNGAMREAAQALLAGNERFHSLTTSAEETGLADESVDLVIAAQAFHWFDRVAARREFLRILREPKWVALIWNERIESESPFLEGYEAILRQFAGDYLAVRHNAISAEDLNAWFGGTMKIGTFRNAQSFDYDGTLGRLMSSSYAPQAGNPGHEPMLKALRELFDRTAEAGEVEFLYETNVYYGNLV